MPRARAHEHCSMSRALIDAHWQHTRGNYKKSSIKTLAFTCIYG